MQGGYSAIAKNSSKAVNAPVVRWFALRNGKIAAFKLHLYTLVIGHVGSEV